MLQYCSNNAPILPWIDESAPILLHLCLADATKCSNSAPVLQPQFIFEADLTSKPVIAGLKTPVVEHKGLPGTTRFFVAYLCLFSTPYSAGQNSTAPGVRRLATFDLIICSELSLPRPSLMKGLLMARAIKQTIRLSKEEQANVQQAAKERGYRSPTAFMRAAIRNELAGREDEITEAEQRTVATLERLGRDIFRNLRGQHALFAVLDTPS